MSTLNPKPRPDATPVSTERSNLAGMLHALERENQRLLAQVETAREAASETERQLVALQQQLRDAQFRNERIAADYFATEMRAAELSKLLVAILRLHQSFERAEVLAGIEDVVVNLVGSEEWGVYQLERGGETLILVTSRGIDAERMHRIPVGNDVVGRSVRSGEPYLPVAAGHNASLPRALIPLVLNGRVTGAIYIVRLLPHKTGLDGVDHTLLELLATHVAAALRAAELQDQAATVLAA